jgi:hypothetical protein
VGRISAGTQAALATAEKNLENLSAGKFSSRGEASASKVPAKVMTQARIDAKNFIKDIIRAAGKKPSQVEPSEITKMANELLKSDPSYIERAAAAIAARTAAIVVSDDKAAVQQEALAKLNALGGIEESPKLVAKAEKAKAEKKVLSAKQAGKTAKSDKSPARKPVDEAYITH